MTYYISNSCGNTAGYIHGEYIYAMSGQASS